MQLDPHISASSAVESARAAASHPILIGGSSIAIFAGLATVVVMMMTKPRNDREFAVALISTLVSSLCGGSFVVLWFGLIHWLNATDIAQQVAAIMAIGGVLFTCGLPGWVLVRLLFNSMEAAKNKTLEQVVHDVKEQIL